MTIPIFAIPDNGHPAYLSPVVPNIRLHLLQKSAVDLIDDLHMPWQQVSHQGNRPFFKSLRHQGMICIGHRIYGDLPCQFPRSEERRVGKEWRSRWVTCE